MGSRLVIIHDHDSLNDLLLRSVRKAGLRIAFLLAGHWNLTDETVKVCACNFSESAFLQAKQAIIELTLRTI